MSDLFFAADTVDSGAAHNLSVQLCEKLDLIGAVCFRLQKIRLLLRGIAMLSGVGKQIIRLLMCQVEFIKERLPVRCRPVPEPADSSVFQCNCAVIFHLLSPFFSSFKPSSKRGGSHR